MTLRAVAGRLKQYVLTGIVLGFAGTVTFGFVHALLIVPIWAHLPGGLVFAIPSGIVLAWAFDELNGGRYPVRLSHGAVFGAAFWALLLPMTLTAAWFRISGLREVLGPIELAIELAITAITGFLAGWWFTRRVRASIALLVALMIAVSTMAGPIPIATGPTAVLLFGSFLPIFLIAGMLIAGMTRAGLNHTVDPDAGSLARRSHERPHECA